MNKLRCDLPSVPARIALLPVDKRGYPVPWFVQWLDGEPEFRAFDSNKLRRAIREQRCWVCGDLLGAWRAYVIGPMCAINRISGEPPCHLECAEFSATACPFLTKPQMVRRENNLPEGVHQNANHIPRNPGVMLLWITRRKLSLVRNSDGGVLFDVGPPERVEAYREGRRATPEEIRESVVAGFPTLLNAAQQEGPGGVQHLAQLVGRAGADLHLDLGELVRA